MAALYRTSRLPDTQTEQIDLSDPNSGQTAYRPPVTLAQRLFNYQNFDPNWPVKSHVIKNALYLLVWRILVVLYIFICFMFLATDIWTTPKRFFAFWNAYTNLTLFAIFLYFCMISVMTLLYLQGKSFMIHHPAFYSFFWTNYGVVVVSAIVVPIIYWAILFPSYDDKTMPPQQWYTNVSQHGIQALFILIEVFIGAMEMTWIHIPWVVFVLVLYMLQSFIRFGILGTWVYYY